MKLSPREKEGLLIHQAGCVAQKRLARGLKLNHPEAVALIACQIQEFARDGDTVKELMTKGRELLGRQQVMPGVASMIHDVQVEATFPDGTKLVTVTQPICCLDGNLEFALYGSFLPVPKKTVFQEKDKGKLWRKTPKAVPSSCTSVPPTETPGAITVKDGEIILNENRRTVVLTVTSYCDRPIQIGSHYNFPEVNKLLTFDRELAYGMRLNIAAGTAVRFEPGDTKTVNLVEIGGQKIVRGGNGLCNGPINSDNRLATMERIHKYNFGHKKQPEHQPGPPATITREQYSQKFGPTVGDKVKLADTSLEIEVEKDYTVYGDEIVFGGGKVIREGMGQASDRPSAETLDTVITNALIVDPVIGIVKADVGIKDSMIVGIGKAGNPDIMDGVTQGMVVGACTEVIAGEGHLLTAGAIDTHVHYICPQLVRDAITSGVTTMIGGGTGPATGTCATTCTPSPNHFRHMLQSTDAFPMNFGFTGKGNTSSNENVAQDLRDQVVAGAMGLKLHEDWGSTPSAIETCLRAADEFDIQVTIHTDTLNESAVVEQSIAAFQGRTIHTYHTEGAGGGHAPDIIKVCGESCVLPSSTNPTRPYTTNTVEEHFDMLMVAHHLDRNSKEDVSFADSRIRKETIAAEDVLQDMGAISMMSSDAQAMGRQAECLTRTWQTADKMKLYRGRLKEETGDNDNVRVRRYLAKYTVNPAIAHGISKYVGSIEVGKLADLVLWHPAFFGAKPEIIIKGGQIASAQIGMPNASIPTPEPVMQRKMFAAYGKAAAPVSFAFVSQESLKRGTVQSYGIDKRLAGVSGCRNLTKKNMVLNDYCPVLTVNPQTYEVHVLNHETNLQELVTCPPSSELSLAQRYFLF